MERALCPVVVGRELELTQLEDALLQANRGLGQVVVLAGDAGMGKTRLSQELQRRAHQVGMSVLIGGCSEAELSLPYLPFLEAVGNHLQNADLESLRQDLGGARDELGHLFPQLKGTAPPGDQGDATQVKLRLFEAVLSLLALSTRSTGLLLVLEDLHWADASTRELLDYLSRRLRNSRILVLGTYRRDEMHRRHALLPIVQGWRRSGLATVIELEPLGPERVGEMVRAMLDARDVGAELSGFLHGRSEGNPFVLEELVKAALDSGDIFRTEDGWDRRAVADFKLPESVRDTILLRLDRLRPDEADLMRTASVLGASFDYTLLAALAGREPADVRASLTACVQQQLLEDMPAQPGRYRFRHALTREAIYDDLILPERESIHARAAEVLEAQPGANPVDVAHHLFEARQYERAVPLCLAAAAAAVARMADVEAASLYERALPHLDEGLERGKVLCELGEARLRAADPGSAERYLSQGLDLLERLGERRLAAHHRLAYGLCLGQRAQPSRALEEYGRAAEVLAPLGPSEDLAMVRARSAFMKMVDGDDGGSTRDAEMAIEVAAAVGANLPRLLATSYLGMIRSRMGDLTAVSVLDDAGAEAEALSYHWVALNIRYNALIALPMERYPELEARIQQIRRLDPTGRSAAQAQLMVHMWRGEYRNAGPAAEEAVRLAREAGAFTYVIQARSMTATVLAHLGEAEAAREALPRLEDGAQEQDRWGVLMSTIAVSLAAGDREAARASAHAILEMSFTKYTGARLPLIMALAVLDCEVPALATRMLSSSTLPDDDPIRLLVAAELALEQGNPAGCNLEALSAQFDGYGFLRLRDRALRLRGQELINLAEPALAEQVLRRSEAGSVDRGDLLEAGRARTLLARLGLQPAAAPEPEPPSQPVTTGERLVTVLFCDIRGYTALSQEEAPASLADRISAFQRWAQQEVQRHHGVVDKFAGDAVMATFNISGDQVDHSLHALRAGLAIRDRAALLGFQIGVGIATGAAVVGSLAGGANLSVLGETTNLASRLQGQAGAGEVVLSAESHRRVRDSLPAEDLVASAESLTLKGFDAPVAAYRLTSAVKSSPELASS